MTTTTRLFAALLILSSSILSTPSPALALELPSLFRARPAYQLASNAAVYGAQRTYAHYYHQAHPAEAELMPAAPQPAYVAAPVQAPALEPTATTTTAPAVAADPYGFAHLLNQYRAMAGLPPVAYDPTLAAWASQNNVAQSRRGLGHHINPNCFQNCGWNQTDVWSIALSWMNSPGHRANMLSPSITRFGIAYGPGPYWTMNAL